MKKLSKSAVAALQGAVNAGCLRYIYGGPCTGDVSYYREDAPTADDRWAGKRHYAHIVCPLIDAGLLQRATLRVRGFVVYRITEAGKAALAAALAQ